MYVVLFVLVFISSCNSKELKTMKTRKESVKGMFYPAQKKELSSMIEEFLKQVKPGEVKKDIVGAIVPHAGYIYSGPVAAYVYKAIQGKKFDTVILIGPSHHVGFKGCAVDINDYWNTPFGEVALDKDLIKKFINDYWNTPFGEVALDKDLIKKLVDGKKVFFDESPHLKEHSLEVQIPFLQGVLKGDFKIVPIIMGQDSDSWVYLSEKLKNILEEIKNKKILIIASTDLSHYYPYDVAVKKDKRCVSYKD